MITLLIGHRGVGKTSLLERLKSYGAKSTFDLDQEIESYSGSTVQEIFETQGEAAFRKVECDVLEKLVNTNTIAWIAVGAGFQGPWPQGARRWWIRRPTDSSGRIFLNRPRLNPELSPYEEYRKRFTDREGRFRQVCDSEITLPEGFVEPSVWEAQLFGLKPVHAGGVVTLLPPKMKSRFYLERIKTLNPDRVEIRDDLLKPEMQREAAAVFQAKQALYSLRHTRVLPELWQGAICDWALELGVPAWEPEIVSRHDRRPSLVATLKDLPTSGPIVKLAVEIMDFKELRYAHDWWMQDPSHRAFLPRSSDGRWMWYRQLFGRQMPISFWREGQGSAPDQPVLADWLKSRIVKNGFAAVLGYPVSHSHTPAEQSAFFDKHEMPVVALPVEKDEMTEDTLNTLSALGLRAAAVTSPHKLKAFSFSNVQTPTARELRSVNTLVRTDKGWLGHNTDILGFAELAKKSESQSVAIWGGGGTKAVMTSVFPDAPVFSVRTQSTTDGISAESIQPSTVVWAVGRDAQRLGAGWPPSNWRPTQVIDLNYSEDSPGKEYALLTGANYVSGEIMFKAQAKAQRDFWSTTHP